MELRLLPGFSASPGTAIRVIKNGWMQSNLFEIDVIAESMVELLEEVAELEKKLDSAGEKLDQSLYKLDKMRKVLNDEV